MEMENNGNGGENNNGNGGENNNGNEEEFIHRWELPFSRLQELLNFIKQDRQSNEESQPGDDPDSDNNLRHPPQEESSGGSPNEEKERKKGKRDIKNKKTKNLIQEKNGDDIISDKQSKAQTDKSEKTSNAETDILNINNETHRKEKNKLTLIDDEKKNEKIIGGYTDNPNSDKESQTSEIIYNNPNYSKDDSKDTSSDMGSQEPNDKEPSNSGSENKEKEKIKKKKKKNKNGPKADPPLRRLNSERVQMSRRDDNDNLDEDKIKIELNQQCKCYKNFLTVQYKPKYEFLDVFKLIVSDNTILFILPFCSKTDVNGFLIKTFIFVLSISCYTTFNILTTLDSATLNFVYDQNKFIENTPLCYVMNLLAPLVVELLVYHFKCFLSLREFYLKEVDIINNFIQNYKNKRITESGLNIKIQQEKTNIKKARNNIENSIHISTILTIIILIINWYVVACYLGIYENSFKNIACNICLNMVYNFVLSFIIHSIEIIISSCSCKKRDIKKFLFESCVVKVCCNSCFEIFTLFNGNQPKEEYNQIDRGENDLSGEENNNNNNTNGTNTRNNMIVNQNSPRNQRI